MCVVDLAAKPIRIIDHITVGDSPEGLAISPKGNLAVTIEARGSNKSKDTWYYHPSGAVGVLRIDGKHVTHVGEVTVGALPEGGVFSADGGYLYVGNFMDLDLSVLRVTGTQLTDTGHRFKLPGQPRRCAPAPNNGPVLGPSAQDLPPTTCADVPSRWPPSRSNVAFGAAVLGADGRRPWSG